MDGDKLLPLTVTVAKNETVDAAPPFPGVRAAIIWALINAGHVVLSIACAFIITTLPSWLQPCAGPVEMTDAEVAVAADLVTGMLWCAVSEAAAAVLALMLPRHRRRLRLLLAAMALVATAASHSKWAGLHRMFAASEDPEGVCFWTGFGTAVIFIFRVSDHICFFSLILSGGQEE